MDEQLQANQFDGYNDECRPFGMRPVHQETFGGESPPIWPSAPDSLSNQRTASQTIDLSQPTAKSPIKGRLGSQDASILPYCMYHVLYSVTGILGLTGTQRGVVAGRGLIKGGD